MKGTLYLMGEKLKNYRGKICDIEKMKKIFEKVEGDFNQNKFYKTLYYLKNKNLIYPIKKDIYYIPYENEEIDENQIIDNFYRNLVKKHCEQYLETKNYYLGGFKAIEIILNDIDPTKEIEIINPEKQAKQVIAKNKIIYFKKLYNGEEKIFKSIIKKYVNKLELNGTKIPVAEINLALLESVFNKNLTSYQTEIIKKTIKKYKKQINLDIRKFFLTHNKHHASAKKLYNITLQIDKKLAEEIKKLINRRSYGV